MLRFVLALLNLLGFPGVGTCLAGHRRTGITQMALTCLGTGLTISGLALTAPVLLPVFKNAEAFRNYVQNGPPGGFGAIAWPLTVATCGTLLFMANWLWSATTTKPKPPPLPGK